MAAVLRQFLSVVCVVALITCASVPSFAQNGNGGGGPDGGGTKLIQAAADPIGQGLTPVISMHDMRGHRWGFAISPYIWKTSNIQTDGGCCSLATGPNSAPSTSLPDLSGEGGALAFNIEFTPHWGAQVFGTKAFGRNADLGGDISGLAPQSAFDDTPGGAGFAGGTFANYTATVFGAMATWDPFKAGGFFRMPISFGFFYGSQTLDFDHHYFVQNQPQTETVRVRRNYPGVASAISFDFTVAKDWLISPGMNFGQGFTGQEYSIHYVVERNGVRKYYPNQITGTPGYGTVYGSFTYKPWGLGYTFTLIPTLAGTHAITLSHKFDWGGGPAK